MPACRSENNTGKIQQQPLPLHANNRREKLTELKNQQQQMEEQKTNRIAIGGWGNCTAGFIACGFE
jgi:hypothetical protein